MSRIRRVAVLTAVLGAATVALAAPASAAPTVDSWQNCTKPIDGAVLCLTATPDLASESAGVSASLTLEPGRTFYYGHVTVHRCDRSQPELTCDHTPLLVGQDVNQVVTESLTLDDAYDYWVSANWRDDQGHTHIGVRVDDPEIPPEW